MPTQAEIDQGLKDTNDLIQKALDAEKKGDNDTAKKLKQQAIKKVDDLFGIPTDKTLGEPQYDPGLDGEGSTGPAQDTDGTWKGRVRLGPSAFVWDKDKDGNDIPSAQWLASSKYHEIVGHCPQIDPHTGVRKPDQPEREVIAYNVEIEKAKTTGISDSALAELKRRKKDAFDGLPEERKKVWKEKEPWLAALLVKPEGQGVLVNAQDFNQVLGRFSVPGGTVLTGAGGTVMAPAEGLPLAKAAESLARGDVAALLRSNPNIGVRLSDVRAVLGGPAGGAQPAPALQLQPPAVAARPVVPEVPSTAVAAEGARPFASTAAPAAPPATGSVAGALAILLDAIRIAQGASGAALPADGPKPFASTLAPAAPAPAAAAAASLIVLRSPPMTPGGVLLDQALPPDAGPAAAAGAGASVGASIDGRLPGAG